MQILKSFPGIVAQVELDEILYQLTRVLITEIGIIIILHISKDICNYYENN